MTAPSTQQSTAVYKYMPPRHVAAFHLAAARFQVWILVRRGNEKSKTWIGRHGYIPKLLDCKALPDCKAVTAQIDVNGEESTAGLVVSPILLPAAFEPETAMADDKAHKHYTVQMDKRHKHYGCVMYKPVYRGQAQYIHADYDLYAIVPVSDPQSNVRVREDGFALQPHSRSPRLYDVQYFLKAAGILKGQELGSPMVRHGEQETSKTDWDDKLDVFWPDGKTVSELIGQNAIKDFYETTLRGRQQYTKDTVAQPHFGKWERI